MPYLLIPIGRPPLIWGFNDLLQGRGEVRVSFLLMTVSQILKIFNMAGCHILEQGVLNSMTIIMTNFLGI